MQEKSKQKITLEYFAAANGYSGFRSYFDRVFNPREYSRIYILKGGPGTGKSTLMKSVYESLCDLTNKNELIYCSSDIKSLDGVIFEGKSGRAAILDGTSPHSTDPRYPGAVEKIVNLGEFWNTDKLLCERERIIEYSDTKSKAYQKAYSYLSLAGSIKCECDRIIKKAFMADDGHRSIASFGGCGRLIDSFGKDGYYENSTLNNLAEKTITVVGLYGSAELYLNRLLNYYTPDDVDIYCSVFSHSKIKAVYIKSENTAYISTGSSDGENSKILDVTSLLNDKAIKENEDYLNTLSGYHESLLWKASDEFKKASESHFLLEDIYKSCVDFPSISDLSKALANEIKDLIL